jgi:NAD(P)-dependent dehydrogenase (short-subunit alcohol dehydrogenase family)
MMEGRLSGKVAVITGAANGIGEATAALFAEEGASVVVLDFDPAGESVAERIRREGGAALFVRADISKEEEVRSAMERSEREYGGIDILVNNAAVFVLEGLEASVEAWHRSLSVNVVGTSLCTRYASEAMKRRGSGAIVNLSSISAFVAQPHFLAYSATKAALVNMTRCMALDLAPFGIRVNCVCPGTIRTAATDRHMAQTGTTEAQFLAENAPLHLLNRVGTPREVAHAILFLASDEASFITATPLMVDGGYVAR